jgi:hypothetical protein
MTANLEEAPMKKRNVPSIRNILEFGKNSTGKPNCVYSSGRLLYAKYRVRNAANHWIISNIHDPIRRDIGESFP